MRLSILLGYCLLVAAATGPSTGTPRIHSEYSDQASIEAERNPHGSIVDGRSVAGCDWTAGFGTAGANDKILALAAFDDGSGTALYAGGEFTTIGGTSISHIARWNGNTWSPVGGGVNGDVATLAVFDDGTGPVLIAGGEFTVAGGIPASHIARWDGTSWSAMGTGVNSWVLALTVFDDGSGPALFAAGRFTRPGTGNGHKIVKWDGASWTSLGLGLDGEIRALTGFQGDNGPQIIAGGSFLTTAENATAKRIAVWNGTTWTELAGGFNGLVNALITFDEGTGPVVYAAGDFNVVNGVTHIYRIVKWDGQAWLPLSEGIGASPRALVGFDDGTGAGLFVGGRFQTAGALDANYLAKWDGADWSPLGVGVNSYVDSLAVLGRSLFVGGSFTTAGGRVSHRIAQYSCAEAPTSADLSVTKSDGTGAVLPGGSLTYTIVAANAGPASTNLATVTDTLPASLSCNYTSVSSGGATGNTVSGSGSLNEILSLPAASAVTYTVDCTTSLAATGIISNTVTIDSGVFDPVGGNNLATDYTTVTSVSLSLAKTAEPEFYDAPLDEITYNFEVKNTGGVTLAGPARILDDQENVECPPGDLPPAAVINCTATRIISQADLDSGSVTNVAIATIGGVSSNAATATATAVQVPRLHIAKALVNEPTEVTVGTVLNFVVTATNEGNISLSEVTVIDEIVTPDEARCPSLIPGATCSLSSTYVVGEADLEVGWLRNTGLAGSRELPDFVTTQLTVEFFRLFADGFETGDTSAWAQTLP